VAISAALNGLGQLSREQEDLAAAQAHFTEALAVTEEMQWKPGRSWSLVNLGQVSAAPGDSGTARRCFAEALAIAWELGHVPDIAMRLNWLVRLAAALGEAERAARLFGAEERLREGEADPVEALDPADDHRSKVAVRAVLGEDAFAAAWAEGQAMTIEEACAYALSGRLR
jgi:hypothetical protein